MIVIKYNVHPTFISTTAKPQLMPSNLNQLPSAPWVPSVRHQFWRPSLRRLNTGAFQLLTSGCPHAPVSVSPRVSPRVHFAAEDNPFVGRKTPFVDAAYFVATFHRKDSSTRHRRGGEIGETLGPSLTFHGNQADQVKVIDKKLNFLRGRLESVINGE